MASTDLQSLRQPEAPVVHAGFFNVQGFELLQRIAKAFASSSLVPAAYRDNVPNCMIALNLAQRMKADELMVMQNLYIVHGNPGWSSKFLTACVNACGRYESLRYEWRGTPASMDYGCRAWTIEKSTGQRLDGVWVDWKMVKAEGWDSKNGSKWKTIPDLMFTYRSAAFWQRMYAPEISMGLSTAEELADVVEVDRTTGAVKVTTEMLRDPHRMGDAQPAAAPALPEPDQPITFEQPPQASQPELVMVEPPQQADQQPATRRPRPSSAMV